VCPEKGLSQAVPVVELPAEIAFGLEAAVVYWVVDGLVLAVDELEICLINVSVVLLLENQRVWFLLL